MSPVTLRVVSSLHARRVSHTALTAVAAAADSAEARKPRGHVGL